MSRKVSHPWDEPASGAWERLHGANTDKSAVLIHSGDAFFKWVKIVPTGTATSAWTGKERNLFYIYRAVEAGMFHNS